MDPINISKLDLIKPSPFIASTLLTYMGNEVDCTFTVGYANIVSPSVEYMFFGPQNIGQLLVGEVVDKFSDFKFSNEIYTSESIQINVDSKPVNLRYKIGTADFSQPLIDDLFKQVSGIVKTIPNKVLLIVPADGNNQFNEDNYTITINISN